MKIRDGKVVEGVAPISVEEHVRWYRSLSLDERLRRRCQCIRRNGSILVLCIYCEARQTIHALQRDDR